MSNYLSAEKKTPGGFFTFFFQSKNIGLEMFDIWAPHTEVSICLTVAIFYEMTKC